MVATGFQVCGTRATKLVLETQVLKLDSKVAGKRMLIIPSICRQRASAPPSWKEREISKDPAVLSVLTES